MNTLPEGWTETTLGQLGRYHNGRGFRKSEWSDSGRPIIRIQNLTGTGNAFNYFGGEAAEHYIARPGDLLVSWAATLGAYIWHGPEAVVNQHIFKVESKIDRKFHKYLLDFKLAELMGNTHGSGMVHITRSRFDAVPVVVPPLDEQRRIVEILEDHLSHLDAAEQGFQRGRAQLHLLERALIDDVFQRRADAEGWPVAPLQTLAAPEQRAMTDGPFGSNLASVHYRPSGAKVLRLQNIGDGVFREADAYISLEHYEALKSHDVRAGDVVVASLGEALPRAAVVPDFECPAIVKADCIRVRLREEIDPTWVVLACRSTRVKKWADKRVHGVGRQRLGMQGVKEIPVALAESADTRAQIIADWMTRAVDLGRLQASIESGQAHLTALRRALLKAALSGQLTEPSVEHDLLKEAARA